MKLIEKIQLQQVSLSIHNIHNQLKFQIKCSQNNQKTQSLHIQQKDLPDKINKQYQKNLKFSDKLKHSTINLKGNNKIASTKNNKICAACLCDQPISLGGTISIDFKINKLHFIMIGICKSKLIQQNFNFFYYLNNQHGYYVLRNDNCVYSHHDQAKNDKKLGFSFNEGDIINVEVNQTAKTIIWRNKAKGLSCSLDIQPSEDLHFCCCLFSRDDNQISGVEII